VTAGAAAVAAGAPFVSAGFAPVVPSGGGALHPQATRPAASIEANSAYPLAIERTVLILRGEHQQQR
jgi:hypothetical protein